MGGSAQNIGGAPSPDKRTKTRSNVCSGAERQSPRRTCGTFISQRQRDSELDPRPHRRAKTTKLLESLHTPGLGNGLSDRTSKAQAAKQMNWGSVKAENFYASENTQRR